MSDTVELYTSIKSLLFQLTSGVSESVFHFSNVLLYVCLQRAGLGLCIKLVTVLCGTVFVNAVTEVLKVQYISIRLIWLAGLSIT